MSVIIPTLNEAENIEKTLERLRAASVEEVIVVDGGSEDDTTEKAKRSGVEVIVASKPGRAAQMNLGAKYAGGDVLLFTHGDTLIPAATLKSLSTSMQEDSELMGGGFSRRFDSSSVLLKFTAWCSDFRGRWWGLFLGDQGIFVRRTAFETLKGFDESVYPGEDLDFSYRLALLGKTKLVGPPVVSSARRFEKRGAWAQTRMDFGAAREILEESRRRAAS